MTIIDLHLIFFMHALVAILESVDKGMAVADLKLDCRGEKFGKLKLKMKVNFESNDVSWRKKSHMCYKYMIQVKN